MKMVSDKLEYSLIGSGDITVIFLNGYRMSFDSWNSVYPEIANMGRVLLFNSPGIGASPKAKEPQVGYTVVNDCRNLMSHLKLEPPVILVAHSLGGVFANLYARMFEDEVAGVVFVDSSHPLEIEKQKAYKPSAFLRVINNGVKAVEKIFEPYKYSQDESIAETVDQIQQSGDFPNIPIAVVTGTKKMPSVPENAFSLHLRYQVKMLDLSPLSKHYICEESGHFPQITESEKVIEAISDTIIAVTSSK